MPSSGAQTTLSIRSLLPADTVNLASGAAWAENAAARTIPTATQAATEVRFMRPFPFVMDRSNTTRRQARPDRTSPAAGG